MIQNSVVLFIILVAIVAGVLRLEKSVGRLFHFLPAPFWCYFIPMALASAHLLPAASPVYKFLTSYGLCACLWLLLLNIRLPALLQVGPTAGATMLVGTLGICTGAVLSYGLFSPCLRPEMWKGVGALSASWTGGSANMLAVKEALAMSDTDFSPFVILDTVVTYAWMGLMIALAPWQNRWDTWVKADRRVLDDTAKRLSRDDWPTKSSQLAGYSKIGLLRSSFQWLGIIALALAVGWSALRLGPLMPLQGALLSAAAWSFILVTAFGILCSLTPLARLERFGASRVGYFCLYLLLAAIGARAQFSAILQTPALLLMAIVLVLIHATFLIAFGYWRRIPLFFLVTASQADIGGTASAPIVAGLYQPSLAPLGLLLAIAANVLGTYIGLATAHACHFFRP